MYFQDKSEFYWKDTNLPTFSIIFSIHVLANLNYNILTKMHKSYYHSAEITFVQFEVDWYYIF